MRFAFGMLACLGVSAAMTALADPPPAPSTAPVASRATAPTPATTPAPAEKAAEDPDVRHFLAEGFKPEMHGGEEVYCRKERAIGSRLSAVKNCGTIKELKLMEEQTRRGVEESQRQQTMGAH
jgi:hypothetical protein